MPLEMLITGRIATLAGDTGFGWVEAIGIRDGRVAFAGTEVDLETRADPFTERIALEPDEVAIPGITDAHLHLAGAADARRHVDLTDAATLDEGLVRIGLAHRAHGGPRRLARGSRLGRGPLGRLADRGRPRDRGARPSRRLLGARPPRAAREPRGPRGGRHRPRHARSARWRHRPRRRRRAGRDAVRGGDPPGHRADPADVDRRPRGGDRGRRRGSCWRSGSSPRTTRARRRPTPTSRGRIPAYARLSERGTLPIRVLASIRDDGLETALAGGLRSGDILGADPAGRARVGWQKAFADGSLGSRTAALLADIEPEPDRPLPEDLRRGVWITRREALRELVDRAAAGGIATQIHAIGDAAVRAALDALTPTARGVPFMPKIEHVQLLDPADVGRASPRPGSWPASSPSISAATRSRHAGCGATAPSGTATSGGSIAATGAVMAFGTDAPVEPFDPWPGIALAVRREDRRWPAGTAPFAPDEALTLDRALRAACVDPAVSAREHDRGRLTVGQRADVVVIPAAAIDDPVEPGGALATARPSIVLLDGRVVFER